MSLEFSIVGGYISMPKEVFVREMLEGNSIVKTLLKWRGTASFREQHPLIAEQKEADIVTINFTGIDYVKLGEDPKELLKRLKSRYKGRVKGWVAVTGTYELMNGLMNIKIDLNADGDEVEYF